MKSTTQWIKDIETFKMSSTQVIEQIQLDAYNSGVRDCIKYSSLLVNGNPAGTEYSAHSPMKGMVKITVNTNKFESLLKQQ